MLAIDTHVDKFLGQPLIAVISTIDKHGHPRSAPIWFHWEDGAAYMFTYRSTLKWRNLQLCPYASLCVDWREPPYKSVILNGPVEEVDRSPYNLVLLMAHKYYGKGKGSEFAKEYKNNSDHVAVFRLVPDRVANYLKVEQSSRMP